MNSNDEQEICVSFKLLIGGGAHRQTYKQFIPLFSLTINACVLTDNMKKAQKIETLDDTKESTY